LPLSFTLALVISGLFLIDGEAEKIKNKKIVVVADIIKEIIVL